MFTLSVYNHLPKAIKRSFECVRVKYCHHVFHLDELIRQPAPTDNFKITHLDTSDLNTAIELTKKYFLSEHVMVKSRNMKLNDDNSIDDYLLKIMKQGNGLLLKNESNEVVGLCVGYASCPVDPNNLRNYAFYRQDKNTKDFLYFMAKLQETPNLWTVLSEQKIYEIKILTVLPQYRRRGLAVMMVEESKKHARDQGYKFTRMNCINPYDYKVAERCMLQCIAKFPLHKLRGPCSPFIKRNSEYNRWVRVYIDAPPYVDKPDKTLVRRIQQDVENRLE